MIRRHETRRPEYFASSHWLQGAVFLVVVGALSYAIVQAVNEARDEAERLVVDLTIRNMRTGMQLAIGEAIMLQRVREVPGWAGENPVGWLGTPPTGYVGACRNQDPGKMVQRVWCFDKARRILVYYPGSADRLAGSLGRGEPCSQLVWRVMSVASDAQVAENGNDRAVRNGAVGLRLEPVGPCRWRVSDS